MRYIFVVATIYLSFNVVIVLFFGSFAPCLQLFT